MKEISHFYKKFFKPGNVCTDTRKIKQGEIFIALRGDNFNGNKYAKQALENGAEIAVVDDPDMMESENCYLVEDALVFLQNLASFHRLNSNFHVIALTGSNGKTTTKELIKAVLAKKYSCFATEGNLNNHIGVPLTLLSIPSETDYAVVEMGANHQGEIEQLCNIASPDCGLITNVGRAHLEGFGSFEGVVSAKSELYKHLKEKSGKIYLNGEDKILSDLLESYKNKIIYNTSGSTCSGEFLESFPWLKLRLTYAGNKIYIIDTQLHGEYNLMNILAAACIGTDHDVPIEEINIAIEEYSPVNNRSQIIQVGDIRIILDCYNANPTSMQLALSSFSKLRSEKKMVILGGMKELGNYSAEEHKKLVELVEHSRFTRSIFIGDEFKEFPVKFAEFFTSFDDLETYLKNENLSGFDVLVKGSRANQLERIINVF